MNQKELISWIRDWQTTHGCRKKISTIMKHLGIKSIEIQDKKAYIKRWCVLQKNPSTAWVDTYEVVTGKRSMNYIAEDIYYTKVEPVLNYRPMSKAETCKALYYNNYPEFDFPGYVAVNIQGTWYSDSQEVINDATFSKSLTNIGTDVKSLVVKPTLDTGGGLGVRKFLRKDRVWTDKDGINLSFDRLSELYKTDFIVQHGIEQNEFFAKFNQSSVNTLRILSYRSVTDERIHILHTLLRVGKKGSVTDNQASGGFAIGVQSNGFLNNFGVNKKGDRFTIVNDIDLSEPILVPQLQDFHQAVKGMAGKMRYSRLIGHDLTMDEQGRIVFIEVNNSSNEINFYQMNNGSLFGRFTDEVIDYCSKHPRSYCFDYVL